jgi:hypothetical protein
MTTSLFVLLAVISADPRPTLFDAPAVAYQPAAYPVMPLTTAYFDVEPSPSFSRPADSLQSPSSIYDVQPAAQPRAASLTMMIAPQNNSDLFQAVPLPYTPGTLGPQPYRIGWSTRVDVNWLPQGTASGATTGFGDMRISEGNVAAPYTVGWPSATPNWILTVTPEFNVRNWVGPDRLVPPPPPIQAPSAGYFGLPPNAYRFATDIQLDAPGRGPFALRLGFTPAIVSDFEANLTPEGYNWDARGFITFQANPQLMLVGGAAYWDRVVDRVVPLGGVVWIPNDHWEWRVLFPKSRVSVFLGHVGNTATWLYGTFEYNVEAYEVLLVRDRNLARDIGVQDKIEFRDWRATVGLRFDSGAVQTFVEAGWVFGREVQFLRNTNLDFDLSSGLVGRMGIRF